jgi:RNA polymerase sigma-54 factor
MPQKQGLHQEQLGVQIQKHLPQQVLLANLVELPVAGLEERVKKELYDNDALEESRQHADADGVADNEFGVSDDGQASDSADDYSADAADDCMDDGDLPVYAGGSGSSRDMVVADSGSLIDDLTAQIGEYDLDDHQRSILSYLVGSLNDNGFVDRELYSIADELAFRHGIFTSEEEVGEMLAVLQRFDPPGIGARNLKECLLIQIDRKISELDSSDYGRKALLELERRIVSDYHETLVRGNADSLPQKLEVSEAAVKLAVDGIRRLNPRPGMSLSESDSERSQTVVPDFVIETDGEGGISLSLNNGYVPSLKIDEEFLQEYDANLAKIGEMNKREREAFAYRKQKVESARMFIEAIRQRRRTLYTTMKAIIALQRDFFLTQDEAALRPMVLRDVAERTGLDESTVSRVKSSKYALVDGSVYPLDFFFMRTRANADGVVVVGRQVEKALMEIIDSEDKSAPYSDEQLVERLREKGMELKHRTVTKYRNKLGVPVAKNRRKI